MVQRSIRRFLKHGMMPQLSVFEAVARHGSFTKAGEELFMAQPTVSVQMKKLSETLGMPLIEQIGKKIYLTDAGETLYASCQEVFASLRKLDSDLASLGNLDTGRLHISVSTTAKDFVPRMLNDFMRHHPTLQLCLQIHNRRGLLERLNANLDDLYIFDVPPTPEECPVVTQRILPNPMVAIAAADHPLAQAKQIPFATLAQEPFLLREPGSGTRLVVQSLFESHGIEPNMRMEMSSNDAIREAVAAGHGVAILSRYTLGTNSLTKGLAILDVTGLPVEQHWVFAYPVGKQLNPMAEQFMHYTRQESKALALNYVKGA